jgi:hypothetical protein
MYLQINDFHINNYSYYNQFIEDIFQSIKDKTFVIGDADSGTANFDLRALATGINLILVTTLTRVMPDDFSVNDAQLKALYEKIAGATFFKTYLGINHGLSSLEFSRDLISDKLLYEIIAHELGHNYLEKIGIRWNAERDRTFQEFFAYAMQGFFAHNINNSTSSITSFMLKSQTFRKIFPSIVFIGIVFLY